MHSLSFFFPPVASLSSLLVLLSLPISVDAADVSSATKAAYIRLASSHATGLSPEFNGTSIQMDMAQIRASRDELFAELRAMGPIDSQLAEIIREMDEAEKDLMLVIDQLEQQPQKVSGNDLVRSFYYGATLQLGELDDLFARVEKQSADTQRLLRRMVQNHVRLQAAVLRLPGVAKRFAGPSSEAQTRIEVDITETWGHLGNDRLLLVNATGKTLRNCTVSVFLTGKAGDVRQNVHFLRQWEQGQAVYATYASGPQMFGGNPLSQTVESIQDVEVAVYCEEFTREGIKFVYRGAERDKDVGSYLDTLFKPASRYRPFSKGVVWDDQRAINVSFQGLQFLPPGSITVTVDNGQLSATKELRFDLWTADKSQWVEFRDINWDPKRWSIKFQFDDTSITRSYRWSL